MIETQINERERKRNRNRNRKQNANERDSQEEVDEKIEWGCLRSFKCSILSTWKKNEISWRLNELYFKVVIFWIHVY